MRSIKVLPLNQVSKIYTELHLHVTLLRSVLDSGSVAAEHHNFQTENTIGKCGSLMTSEHRRPKRHACENLRKYIAQSWKIDWPPPLERLRLPQLQKKNMDSANEALERTSGVFFQPRPRIQTGGHKHRLQRITPRVADSIPRRTALGAG